MATKKMFLAKCKDIYGKWVGAIIPSSSNRRTIKVYSSLVRWVNERI